jgi:hypothetical protein
MASQLIIVNYVFLPVFKLNLLMNFVKNIQFSSNIKAAGSLKEFNFRKQRGISESLYQIDVSDERGNRHFFSMQLSGAVWKIGDGAFADWIMAAEPMLHEAIVQQETQI